MIRRFSSLSAIASLAVILTVAVPVAVRSEISPEPEAAVSEPLPEETQETLGVAFQLPEGFSSVRPLARRTTGIVYPNRESQRPQMTVRFAEMDSNADGWVKFSPAEQMMYAKYLFLGNNSPAGEYSQRIFFGQPLTGEAQTIRTRDGYRYIELFIVPLEKSQRQIAIAFESDTRLPLTTVETAIDKVTQSLQELDEPTKKKKKK